MFISINWEILYIIYIILHFILTIIVYILRSNQCCLKLPFIRNHFICEIFELIDHLITSLVNPLWLLTFDFILSKWPILINRLRMFHGHDYVYRLTSLINKSVCISKISTKVRILINFLFNFIMISKLLWYFIVDIKRLDERFVLPQ